MRLRKLIGLVAAMIISGGGAATLAVVPAWAYPTIYVCNFQYSIDPIQAYNNDTGREWLIGQGNCAWVDDTNGNARVDVDPSGGRDVDSWKKRKIGDPWPSTCYVNEDGASNPYGKTTSPYGTSYWNFGNSYCAG